MNMNTPPPTILAAPSVTAAAAYPATAAATAATAATASATAAFNDVSTRGLWASLATWFTFDNTFSKFIFTVALVLVLFLLLRIVLAIVLFIWPAEDSPYLISGILQGTSSVTIAQDPVKESGKLVARSRDQDTGMEFTWSVWLFIDTAEIIATDTTTLEKEYVIFTKGNPKTQNAPGLYVGRERTVPGSQQVVTKGAVITATDTHGGNAAFVKVRMDVYGSTVSKEIKIRHVPMQKWFHVAMRLQNSALDVYVNGTVTEHLILESVPMQNYADVFVFPTDTNPNGGSERFTGYLADLVYFPYALNIYRLNAIVLAGPSKNMAAANTTSLEKGKDNNYMSPEWYAASAGAR